MGVVACLFQVVMNETPAFCEVCVHKRMVLAGGPILHSSGSFSLAGRGKRGYRFFPVDHPSADHH